MAVEEYKAIAGLYRASVELDDAWFSDFPFDEQYTTLSLHLAPPRSTTDFPSSGRVYPMDDVLPFNICHDDEGHLSSWWAAVRPARAGSEGDDTLCLSLQLGDLLLQGRSTRDNEWRCRTFTGNVLYRFANIDKGKFAKPTVNVDTSPCVIGRFTLELALPSKTDAAALESRYRKRIETRPPPFTTASSSSEATRDEAPFVASAHDAEATRDDAPLAEGVVVPRLSEDEAKAAWLARLDARDGTHR